MTPEARLAERHKTHGDFREVARIAQSLRYIFRSGGNWDNESLSSRQREALDGMAVKIARILSGDPRFADHWNDLIGYVMLVLPELQE